MRKADYGFTASAADKGDVGFARIVVKEQVAAFFEVTPRTVDNYIEKFGDELRQNGYEVLRGKRLNTLKSAISARGDHEADFVTKTTVLGIFDFRAFLNLAMLIVESERARLLRQAILDIVIDTNYNYGKYQFAFLAYHMLTMSFIYFNIWQIR